MLKLKNKTAVITGGGSGIGAAIVEKFAQAGAHIHILDIHKEATQKFADSLGDLASQITVHTCDVSNQSQVLETLKQIDRADILINNAGVAHVGNLENCAEEDFDRIMNINVKGAYNVLYGIIPLMKKQQGGVILNIASIAAWVGIPDRFVYSVSKGAIAAMTLSVAKDYIHDNIRCNSISPARVHTPFVDGFIQKNYPGREEEMFENLSKTQPIGRMGKPAEIADLALYLCSEESSFITGNDFPIDGGFIKLNN